jgi:copper chaperone CopZ
MKKVMSFLVVALFSLSVSFAQDSKKEEQVQIKTSAVCKMCKSTIEKQLSYEKGVKTSNLDVDSKIVTVTYNPKKTDINRIKKAITESGYDADEVVAQEKAYNNLDPCCKKDAHKGGKEEMHK